ncbi:beta-galactosidase, domain 2-domain-containing protein [Mycena albidolilacea]|uniref:Beta-galactosidase, domain 2-domain-containing protein n=1 Tax=Mycena albidolilacea TaxID=1033008 RepID=A0AAD6Z4M3_9AGAR|nr:beta-galactosidase, domain 2-domain-containing protein [Mycena albidolilacea]
MTDRTPFSTAVAMAPNISAAVLRNPETQAGFNIARQSDMKATTTVDFKLNIATKTTRNLTVPVFGDAIRLVGVQSKIIVLDFRFGNNTLVYSTVEVLSHSVSILGLWLPDGEFGEFSILGGSKKREVISGTGDGFHQVGNNLVLSYKQQKTQSVLQFDNVCVLLLPRSLAYTFWAPTLTNVPIVTPKTVVFVNGPYLIQSLGLNGLLVVVTGDIANTATLEVFAPVTYTSLQWNGKTLATHKTSYGSLKAPLPKPGLDATTLQKSLTLSGWKVSIALPEADTEYDDSKWVVAHHLTTPNPTQPHPSGANLTIQGGTASGWSAWVNSDYLAASLVFGENILTVVIIDHSGHEQRDMALNPRGILGATLLSMSNMTFMKWTIAGNAGDESNIDPIQGVIAEGGFHAERLGWHLPGFDDSLWVALLPSDGVDNGTIAFFRTTSRLDVLIGYDVSLAFILSSLPGSVLRAQLYVNGYQYGKFVPQIGDQIAFPVPPGILNVHRENTIGLSLCQTAEGVQVDVQWHVLGVYESAWDPGFDASALQPGSIATHWSGTFTRCVFLGIGSAIPQPEIPEVSLGACKVCHRAVDYIQRAFDFNVVMTYNQGKIPDHPYLRAKSITKNIPS